MNPVESSDGLRFDYFSDAELAAEYWRAEADYLRAPYRHRDAVSVKLDALHRFATTPHYWQHPRG